MLRSRLSRALGVALALLALVAVLVLTVFRRPVERWFVVTLDKEYVTPAGALTAVFDGPDATRTRVAVRLEPMAEGFAQPTDLANVPGQPTLWVVAEKGGALRWGDLADGTRGQLGTLDVLTASEQGLLGIAFHPRFPDRPELFVDLVASVDGEDRTRILRCALPGGTVRDATLGPCETVLEQAQPYQNHNAGQLAFGPDGMLYVGLGYGGLRDDPLGAGQDRATWLGSILRIDVDRPPYAVPPDNPFVGEAGVRPEIWAYGVRNPWRFAFTPDGRLVVADVGQDTWEELSVAGPGANLGWSLREGPDCFPDTEACAGSGLVAPFHHYGRDSGASITGGVVATGDAVPEIRGRYVFGDFTTGRLWAIEVPGPHRTADPVALGRWPILPSAFARDAAGDVWVAGYGRGVIYRVTGA